jgi:hypothetical protein
MELTMEQAKFDEIGVGGLREYAGFISEAYNSSLNWPSVQPLYSRMRRSDPEVSIVRNVYSSLARRLAFDWELPDDATDPEKQAQEFGESVLEDTDGGVGMFADTMLSNVPFFGWGWWEVLWGLRAPDWRPPGDDEWRSEQSDGLIGIRRMAWRDSSSFARWKFNDAGRMTDMIQQVPNGAGMITIPKSRSLHLTFGDAHNPEGLSPLEALWRLERIKYGLEVIQGIGFEHSAGHLSVKAEQELTAEVKADVRVAARNIMMAQEGNYAVWPMGFTGEIIDSNFSAAAVLLETIKYWGVLKLTLFNMQWVALSATTGIGSYSAMSDSSSMFMITFNAMLDGFASQMDAQIGRRLFAYNDFGRGFRRPHLKARPLEKVVSLSELATILGPLKATMPLGDDDFKAIRAKTGFMPETLPEINTPAPTPEIQPVDNPPADGTPATNMPMDENGNPMTDAQAVQASMNGYLDWARINDPEKFYLLTREVDIDNNL